MNHLALLALLAVSILDPTGDAIGDGSLEPPTATIYANSALFDLQQVQLEVDEAGAAVLRVTLGALGAAAGVPDLAELDEESDLAADQQPDEESARLAEMEELNLSELLAVVDVYLDSGAGGAGRTLEGPNMLLPIGSYWNHAVRISAEGAWGISYLGEAGDADAPVAASQPASAPEVDDEQVVDDLLPAPPSSLLTAPLAVRRSGTTLEIALPWRFDPDAAIDLFAMTGVHDPFSPTGWRSLSAGPSPWAFSSDQQVPPVIDLLAPDAAAQAAALSSGVLPLPPRQPGMSLPLSPWLWLMVGGLAVALLGLVLRGRVPAPVTAPEEATEAAPESDEDAAAAAAAGLGADGAVDQVPDDAAAQGANAASEEAPAPGAALPDEGASLAATETQPAALEAPAALVVEPATETPALEAPRPGFTTEVEDSFLQVEEELVDPALEDEDESFWHPASRGKSTVVEEPQAEEGGPLLERAATEPVVEVESEAE